MNHIRNLLLVGALPLSVLLAACEGGTSRSGISEGIIEYEVSYPSAGAGNPLANILPTKMTFMFREDITASEMKTGMGAMKTTFISDIENRKLITLMKIFDEKIAVTLSEDEVRDNYAGLPPMKIQEVGGTKKIAGYTCRKAKVMFSDESRPDITLYYTDAINISDPNWSIPYPSVKGVLLEYEMEQNSIVMKFRAKKVIEKELNDDDFRIPDDYKIVTKEYMNQKTTEISEIFNNFN